ncbi:MAG TPA: glutamate synthase subunit alpha, partial [Phycisphaerae bacterium]|nr:glutamate synthase subunit alpha [Phycisphaerae bacterium]
MQYTNSPADKPVRLGLYDPEYEHDSCGVGFIAHIKGKKSHDIVINAITMLEHMEHRGACGCEENTGDGAGILTGLPHAFLAKVAKRDAGINLPPAWRYGAGIVFLPTDPEQRTRCEKIFEEVVGASKLKLVGWRDVPVDNSVLGWLARGVEPAIRQIFIARGP